MQRGAGAGMARPDPARAAASFGRVAACAYFIHAFPCFMLCTTPWIEIILVRENLIFTGP